MVHYKRRLKRLLLIGIATILFWYCIFDFFTDKSNLHNIEIKLRLLEDELFLREQDISKAREQIEEFSQDDATVEKKPNLEIQKLVSNRENNCWGWLNGTFKADIQMIDLYKDIPFENIYGGKWTQGWEINYDNNTFSTKNILKVFVVPHSHNDPGWLRTFDEYHERTTSYILYNMLNFLAKHPDMKFIWAEISFFARWFETLPYNWKKEVMSFVDCGQLEFVTGGWVMPDEANSHWLGVTIQLIEGQNWLKKNLNVVPKNSWAIDPFGHSATMPYLFKRAGIKNILIQRTHYEVKKRLAQEKSLEFHWSQIWGGCQQHSYGYSFYGDVGFFVFNVDQSGQTKMFTHMMPFLSYSAPYSCGPDPEICCQFDFERLPDLGRKCKWGVQPEKITDDNVAEKANLLLDQWRKKSTLYRTRSLLVPLGDDFRYAVSYEWKNQYLNYKKLFTYMNNRKDLYVEAKFATLSEYFDSVREESSNIPSLSGDFFTYSDQDDHYWSGYYTSRPYYKRMDRVLLHYLRSAEMLYSWSKWPANTWLERRLRNATHALSIFQHHDGITGTARERVMEDYARMLDFALKSCRLVMQYAAFKILNRVEKFQPDIKQLHFDIDESHWPDPDDSLRPTIILDTNSPKRYVTFHNSLPRWRSEIIDLQIQTPFVEVTDTQGNKILAQVSPTWTWHNLFHEIVHPQASSTKYTLQFKVKVPPLGLTIYTISLTSPAEVARTTTFANITILTQTPFFVSLSEYPREPSFGKPREFRVAVKSCSVSFTKYGFLKIVSAKNNTTRMPIHLEFLKYGTKSWFADERSGAYLFLPNGPAEPLPLHSPVVVISEGALETSVSTGLKFAIHKTILRDGIVEIRNLVDIGNMDNNEIVMRISTNIRNGDTFYTDLNGFQIIKRNFIKKLPIQANYYPVPSSIYIEDDRLRLTVLSAQPLGGSSLASGQIDIMQDRRLKQSDGRGLGEGVLDNKPVRHIFRLIVEDRYNCPKASSTYTGGALTVQAHRELQELLHPIDKLIFKGNHGPGFKGEFGTDHRPLDEDIELGFLQHLPEVYQDSARKSESRLGIILHRTNLDQCHSDENFTGKVNIRELLNLKETSQIFHSSLTFVKKHGKTQNDSLAFCPMDIKAFIIQR